MYDSETTIAYNNNFEMNLKCNQYGFQQEAILIIYLQVNHERISTANESLEIRITVRSDSRDVTSTKFCLEVNNGINT